MKGQRTLSKLNKGVLLAVVFALLLASVAVIVYARYTNSQHAQRTIAPYDLGGARFSSNYLNSGNSRDNVRTIYVTNPLQSPATTVTVSNYQQGKQTQPNSQNVAYTITVRLVKYDAGSVDKYVAVDAAYLSANSLTGYRVTVKKGAESPVTLGNTVVQTTFNSTLTGGEASSDAYTLSFGADFTEDQPNLYVEMIAVPTDGSLPTIRGVFKTGLRSEGATNAWTGAFTDSTANAPDNDDFDGFNYTVSGVGSGTFTLKWDSTKVTLSDVSIRELLSIPGATQVGNSIAFAVDSDDLSRYDLQFYKVNVSGMTWGNMNSLLGSAGEAVATGKAVGYFFVSA